MFSQEFENEYFGGLKQARADAAALVPAFAELAKAADDRELTEALRTHVNDLSHEVDRLGELHLPDDGGETDETIAVLAARALRTIAAAPAGALRDAAMIAAIQHVQHYQIATFGTLAAYAKMLGRHDEKRVLGAFLEDERAFDEDLTVIAGGILAPIEAPMAARSLAVASMLQAS